MQEKNPLELDSRMRCLLEAAIHAPSGDNCQPWRFQVEGQNKVSVYTVAERARSFFDYGERGTLISVGAVLENMRIQAASDGLATDVTYNDGDYKDGLQAVVRIRPDPDVSIASSRVTAMLRRTVNRRPFLPVRPARKKLMAINADPVEGVEVSIIDRRRHIRQWARLIYLADRIRYSHPVIHEELFSKILFSKEMASERRLGLEIDRLGAGPTANSIMRFLQPWDRMKRLQKYGIDRVLASQSRFLGLATGALVLVSVKENTHREWIRAGMQVERLWVAAEEQGMCVHPMTVVLFLNQRFREEGMAGFLPEHRPLLEEIDTDLKRLTGDGTATMLFRLGTGWRMKNTAVRMPLGYFLAATGEGC